MFFRSTIREGVARFEVGQGRDGGRHGLSVGVADTVDAHQGLVMPKNRCQKICFPSLEAG